jgi:N-acetylmuramic acid 6-phosphate etherase
MQAGGRLFYMALAQGRLGVVDASEIPPTYGMPHGKVIGLIAGGDKAIRKAVENAEDDAAQGWKDLKNTDQSTRCINGNCRLGRTPMDRCIKDCSPMAL